MSLAWGVRQIRLLEPFLPRAVSLCTNLGSVPSQSKRFAGHSHWQNVRHTKEAKDKVKSKASQYYMRAVASAIKIGGGSRDPKINSHLASILAEAKANSVPFSTLERVLKADTVTDPYVIEVQAQGGLFVLIESCTKPINLERQRLAGLVKRYGCAVSPAIGRITTEFFEHVGVISVPSGIHAHVSSLDAAINLGIEVGANEVVEVASDGQSTFEFHCDPVELNKLHQSLEQQYDITPSTVEDIYIPKSCVEVPPAAYDNLTEMYAKIRDQHDGVDRIFDNVTLQRNQR